MVLCTTSAPHYRARNYLYSLIGWLSLTRHHACHTIGLQIRLWCVVVIGNLRLAQQLARLRSAAWCLWAVIGQETRYCSAQVTLPCHCPI